MTDKDLAHRYADVPSLVADLEDALAHRGRAPGHLDRRGDRGHPHAARPRPPPAAVPDAPLAAAARRSSACSPSRVVIVADRLTRGRRRASSSGTGTGTARAATPAGHAGRLGPARLRPRLRPARRRRRSTPTRPRASSTATPAPPGRPRATRPASRARARPASASTSTPSRRSTPSRCRSRRPSPAGRRRSTPRRRARRPTTFPTRAGRRSAAARSTASDKRFKLDTGGNRVPLLPRLDHEAGPGRRARRDLRDPALPGSRRVGEAPRTPRSLKNAARRRARRAKRSSASASRRSHSSGNGDARRLPQLRVTRSCAVKPGIVLSSLTSTRSPSSTKKSTRARPAQPTRTNVSQASRRTSSSTCVGQPGGHDQLHAAVGCTWPRSRTSRRR